MKNRQKRNQNYSFAKEYSEIVDIEKNSVKIERQWTSEGDQIQKFSLYDNYTPVKTSGSTTLISEI